MRHLSLAFLVLASACGGESGSQSDGGPRVDTGTVRTDGSTPSIDSGAEPADAAALSDAEASDAAVMADAGAALRPVIVAAGANHWRALSIDGGNTFCQVGRASEPDATGFDNPYLLRTISFYQGRFVSGSWRAIYVSTNGFEWIDVTGDGNPAFGQWVAGVAYGNDWWVATGGYGRAMRSRDLMAWEDVSDELMGTQASRSLAFAGGVFVTGRDAVGWWSSADGTAWTQIDPAGDPALVADEGVIIERPGYDRGHGVRLRGGWPDQIQRAEDREGAPFVNVHTSSESVTRFAFGEVPAADFVRGRVPVALADCLGL